ASILAADERTLTRQAWPLRSRQVLETAASPTATIEIVRDELPNASDRAESFTLRKRVWLWAGTLGPALLLASVAGIVILFALFRDPQIMRLDPVVGYVRSSNYRKNVTRDPVGMYIAGHFRQRILDQRGAQKPPFGFPPSEWATADSIVAA